jgi:hypothetical protein
LCGYDFQGYPSHLLCVLWANKIYPDKNTENL